MWSFNYINSTATANTEKLDTEEMDRINIDIVEGNLTDINVNINNQDIKKYICDRLLMASTIPFNREEMETQLRLLREDPLFDNIEAKLIETGEEGKVN
jgi:hemolysin activation/secretion protein